MGFRFCLWIARYADVPTIPNGDEKPKDSDGRSAATNPKRHSGSGSA